MKSPRQNDDPGRQTGRPEKRPLLVSLLCFFSWIYYGILTGLFLLALFYSGWISEVIHQYLPDGKGTTLPVSLLFFGMFLLHGTAFTGVIFLWYGRSKGYLVFAIPTILITVSHLFRPDISWISTAIYTILVILFGIYYRQLKRSAE
ncbi:MAG: hypothetical protein JXA23_01920 [Bacteroidales bacterium]|nr:hypothetical protein [Bacteroidales bacterium]